jgi:hypothetical protein
MPLTHISHQLIESSVMASQNQLELGSLPAVPKLHNPTCDVTEGNNVEDIDDFKSDWYRTRVPMVSILACDQRNQGEKNEEGSFELRNQGGWKTMPFIIGELLPTLLSLMVYFL